MADPAKKMFVEYEELGAKLRIFSGQKTILVVYKEKPIGDLAVHLLDYRSRSPLRSVEYGAKGNGLSFSGKTGKRGEILHKDVLSGYYTLTIKDQDFIVPTVAQGDEPYQLWMETDSPQKAQDFPEENEPYSWGERDLEAETEQGDREPLGPTDQG